MGGRGSNGGSGIRESDLEVEVRKMSYRDYKQKYNGENAVKYSYDEETKTIEVKVDKGLEKIRNLIPNNEVETLKRRILPYLKPGNATENFTNTKYLLAKKMLYLFKNSITINEKLPKEAPQWMKEAYKIAKLMNARDKRKRLNG
jgi:hypothetical protein